MSVTERLKADEINPKEERSSMDVKGWRVALGKIARETMSSPEVVP
jgi:hypothetical protein